MNSISWITALSWWRSWHNSEWVMWWCYEPWQVGSPKMDSSVQFSCSVLSDSFWHHVLQHTRLPCPSPTPRVLLKFMSTESVMSSSHLILPSPPLLFRPSSFPSIRVFSNESELRIRWPKYWSCSFSISPSNEYSGLISFRMDWLDLLAVQGTLKNLLQHIWRHNWMLQKHQFFSTQLSSQSNSHIHTWLLEKP